MRWRQSHHPRRVIQRWGSIELSLSVGRELDPEAYELAAAELHRHVLSEDLPTAQLLEDARWLISLPGADEIPPTTRVQVVTDMQALDS